jgi:hypothetical protein
MARCDVCGNDYDKAFRVTMGTRTMVFDSFDPKTGRRRNLGTFSSRAKAEKHERAVQYFKRRG